MFLTQPSLLFINKDLGQLAQLFKGIGIVKYVVSNTKLVVQNSFVVSLSESWVFSEISSTK